ncbi:MAG: efflux RND transporter periplasmic adaptor subunit [Burkholderiales bacterium]
MSFFFPRYWFWLACLLLLAGCGPKTETPKKASPGIVVTTAKAETRDIRLVEKTMGEVDSPSSPQVSSEVSGRVTEVYLNLGDPVKAGQTMVRLDSSDLGSSRSSAEADVMRLEALVANQKKVVERNRDLLQQNFISPLRVEELESQLSALDQQLRGARAQQDIARRNVGKSSVIAPVSGRIEQKQVSKGDYVTPGKLLFQIATSELLRVRLPFPETVAAKIQPGQAVTLISPLVPDKPVDGKIEEIRALVGASNRSIEAIIKFRNPGDWRAGSSVNGQVVVGERNGATTVPAVSVVLRPAGKIVYVVQDGKAEQRIVETGVRQEGYVEILSGIKSGETVVLDGAGFLTDKAQLIVQAEPPKASASTDTKEKTR